MSHDLPYSRKQPPELLFKKGVLAEDCDFIKKRLWQVFSCEFCEILTTPFLQNTSGRLLLHSISNYQKMIILTLQSTSHEICQKIILSTLQLTSHEIMSHDLHHTC